MFLNDALLPIQIGDSYVTSDCTARRTCVDQGNGVSDFTDEYLGPCLSSATCQLNVNTGERECQCNAGLVGDGRVECIRKITSIFKNSKY